MRARTGSLGLTPKTEPKEPPTTAQQNPESGTYTYDASNNLSTRLDANGITTTSTYL
jgi:YD repeat-containing protein